MLDEHDIFKDYLQQFNLRWTPQRKLILDVFFNNQAMSISKMYTPEFASRTPPSALPLYIEL